MEGYRAFDATNSVRLCDRCEGEHGVSAGADKGDRACAVCGAHETNHVYPAIDRGAVERAEKAEAEVERLRAEVRYLSGQDDEGERDEHGGLGFGGRS